MKKTPLAEYLAQDGKTQTGLGAQVGLTQGAIGKMVRDGRNISVIEHDDTRIELFEEKVVAQSPALETSDAA